MIQTATEIINDTQSAKEAIIQATNKFWETKHEIWKNRCNTTIKWEKQNKITTTKKKQKSN